MQKDDFFDVLFEGTSVQRCIDVLQIPGEVLVIDVQENYGTTFDLPSLARATCIKDLHIKKATSEHVLIEGLPGIFANAPHNVCLVDFVPIDSHFYYDEDLVKFVIPYTMSQVADSKFMSLLDKRYLIKVVRRELELKKVVECFSPEFKRIIHEAYSDGKMLHDSTLEEYIKRFDKAPFLYPKQGHREVSEAISRFSALKGIKYYISPDIRVQKVEKDDHKFVIRSEYGNIYAKEYLREESRDFWNFRVLMVKKVFFAKTFVAAFRLAKKVWCLGLDSTAEVCPRGLYLLYVWKKGEEVTNDDLKRMGIDMDEVEMDIAFKSASTAIMHLNKA